MIFNLKPSVGRRGGIIKEDSFEFGGSHAFASDDDGHFELALFESGTLDWLTLPSDVDIFIVGAGQNGGPGYKDAGYVNSGKGGDAGRTLTMRGVRLGASCTVVIGSNGADSSVTSDDVTYTSANGPAPRAGGTAAKINVNYADIRAVNTGGTAGEFAYGEDTDETMIPALQGKRFAASGGAGHAVNNNYVYTDQHGGIATGGATDGGAGGNREHHNGYAATGYGNGGGGGYGDGLREEHGAGGSGSGGMILIRDHR